MKTLKTLAAFAAALCCTAALAGHPMRTLDVRSGLPSNEVNHVYQDGDGYVWIATNNGLCRYDGLHTRIYKSNLHTPGILRSNCIESLCADSLRRLWIGTRFGLHMLDCASDSITIVDCPAINRLTVKTIIALGADSLLCLAGERLYVFRPSERRARLFSPDDNIQTAVRDDRGDIWFGSWRHGLTRLTAAPTASRASARSTRSASTCSASTAADACGWAYGSADST